MTKDTHKISVRLDAELHKKMQGLVKFHPKRSLSAVVEQMITSALSRTSTAEARILLLGAVANMGTTLDLLSRDRPAEPEALVLLKHFYARLLELAIDIEGVEP